MANVNKVFLIGRVGRDPEKRYTGNAEAISTWSVATNRKWKSESGEPREHTEWHNIVAFRQLAEQAHEFLVKGRLIYVEGRLETRSWDDRETGKKVFRTEIICDTMRMLDSKADGDVLRASPRQAQSSPATRTAVQDRDNFMDVDDVPF